MKHRLSRILISMLAWLRRPFLIRKKEAARNKASALRAEENIEAQRNPKTRRPPKQVPVKRRIFAGRIWRANYRAIREFRMTPVPKEPGI
jgi:hypothetical protein